MITPSVVAKIRPSTCAIVRLAKPIDHARVQQWIDFYEKAVIRREPVRAITINGGGDITT
jgi:hypothetical protein